MVDRCYQSINVTSSSKALDKTLGYLSVYEIVCMFLKIDLHPIIFIIVFVDEFNTDFKVHLHLYFISNASKIGMNVHKMVVGVLIVHI